MTTRSVSAEIVSSPGRLGDAHYIALRIDIEGFSSPYVLTLAMPAIGYRALAEQVDAADLYNALAQAINRARLSVEVRRSGETRSKTVSG